MKRKKPKELDPEEDYVVNIQARDDETVARALADFMLNVLDRRGSGASQRLRFLDPRRH
jgi:hypothetical protein